jgi:hypothetical protein
MTRSERTGVATLMKSLLLAFAIFAVSPAASAEIIGAWKIHGSVFFNAVDTTCHFKADGPGVVATCEYYGKLENFTQATIAGNKVGWSWDAHQAVLAFQGTLTSDTAMKGEIIVRGFTGSFTATKQ